MNRLLASVVLLPLVALLSPGSVAATLPPRPEAPLASAHQRVLPLQGGQNFRDLGGYRTTDGRIVRWGLLYRSGSMHFLTPGDQAYLETLGIRTVCDFRDNHERATEPAMWPAGHAPRVFADDYDLSLGGIGKNTGKAPTVADAKEAIGGLYPVLLQRFNGQYRRMFGELLAGHVPLAFNCTAGKDRTGIAAALILTALGVPRDTIVADYVLTNQYFDPQKVVHSDNQASIAWKKLPPDVIKAYMAADPAYIERAFAVMDAHSGGAIGYLKDELGLGASQIKLLRKFYTDPA
jgi:protein-tyrosine phosphatase